jgi:hypothetical protein
MNASLAPNNGKLATCLSLTAGRSKLVAHLLVATEKLDKTKRKPVPAVIASFCPFCGTRLPGGDA